MPAPPQPGAPQVRWTVAVERTPDTNLTYWIFVTNLTGQPVGGRGPLHRARRDRGVAHQHRRRRHGRRAGPHSPPGQGRKPSKLTSSAQAQIPVSSQRQRRPARRRAFQGAARVWRAALTSLLAFDEATDLGRSPRRRCSCGERDGLFSREEQECLAAAIPRARLIAYPEPGHSPHLEGPERVAND